MEGIGVRKPTVIGGGTIIGQKPVVVETEQVASLPVVISSTFPMSLTTEQQQAVGQKLAKTDFKTLSLQGVATLGSGAEVDLHRTLDGFLARINQLESPRLFKLVTELNDAVGKENLPELADRILNGKLSLGDRLRGMFSKKAIQKAISDAWEETMRLVQGRTKTLVDLVNSMERELRTEQAKLTSEITSMDQLKDAYRQRFNDFIIEVAFMSAFLEQAKVQVAQIEQTCDPQNMVEKRDLDELHDKLQALESRTLALEGTLTRLPADQLVIRQLQNAGISTLQETSTTAASRFASIKMTLLTLHGAMVTTSVQKLAGQGAALDKNLTDVRGKLMSEVVTTAANAPGDNRVAQAEQLRGIVAETANLANIVEQARENNKQKFEQARQMFDSARQEMLALGQQVRP